MFSNDVGRRKELQFRHAHLPARVDIIDCTLRDGEQTAGVWFTPEEKLAIGRLLDGLGVAVLDAGFPASCPEEIEVLQELRRAGLRARVAATARPVAGDVRAAHAAQAQEVFLFLPTSAIRLASLGFTRAEAERRLRAGAEEVLSWGMDLNVVAEDAWRTDRSWLTRLLEGLLSLPVRRFVLCDTVGAAFPQEMETFVADLVHRFEDQVEFCMHCHNDFGLATANSLAGVLGGARSVSCTVNGIGERAGNADLAEVVAALEHLFEVEHGIEPSLLSEVATEVERASGIHTSPLKPVTGTNVYSHESGVHVDGLLADARCYEFLPAAWSGRTSRVVLGKHSGASSVTHVLGQSAPSAAAAVADVRALVQRLKAESRRRSKGNYGEAHARHRVFSSAALAGIDPAWLVRAAAEAGDR
jgi:isopropylmalate/homocitrate/citramalate synthase